MCKCCKPKKLPKNKTPEDCSKEQIKECHPEAKGHPCCEPKPKDKE